MEFFNGQCACCETCGGMIQYIVHDAWNGVDYETLDAWWAHWQHPEDEHEAVPFLNEP